MLAKIDADKVGALILVAIVLWALIWYLLILRRVAKSLGRSVWLVWLLAFICPPVVWAMIPREETWMWWLKRRGQNPDDKSESS